MKQLKNLRAVTILTDGEAGSNVPAEGVSLTAIERYAEAAFAISVAREIGSQFHPGSSPIEIPAYCGVIDLAFPPGDATSGFTPEVVTGPTTESVAASLGIALARFSPSLGFHRYEPVCLAGSLPPGARWLLPDKEFRLRPYSTQLG